MELDTSKSVRERFNLSEEELREFSHKADGINVKELTNVQLEMLANTPGHGYQKAAFEEITFRAWENLNRKQETEINDLRSELKEDKETRAAEERAKYDQDLKEKAKKGDTAAFGELLKSRGVGYQDKDRRVDPVLQASIDKFNKKPEVK